MNDNLYAAFLRQKIRMARFDGFDVSPDEINPKLKPHTRDIVRWALKGGRRAVFASFGLHKTATQLELMRLIGVYTEMCKDGSKMGVGSPEYVLLFHKPQTDRTKGYADMPIRKSKDEYSLARWQIDAHAFWRSSGNRLLTAEELAALGPDQLASLFTKYTLSNVYDYEFHVKIGEELQARGALPSTFMSLAPGSHHPDIWHDVTRMLTLNGEQAKRAVEKHVCPLQFDIVDRLIERYSNPDEFIYDPFCGLGTVPYRAILKGRRGGGSELNSTYFMDQVHYLRAAERQFSMPSLFDTIEDAA
ncbi:DNA methyltransferase [Burkholderia pseudomallei]|uniref:DNA methyltransferase n=1 Tax=Burkholderia pseudomallei TaxID=28450 RepID=UPI00052AA9E0|nr:DNA methyltransferase [Burkholderia pseudomallei]AIV87216.1 DNA methylase family protein [Burkholderia pseudomallei B03]AIV92098.1 DNA methylase family protein [Burkholderia pseudomallei A79A]KGX97751.1 DNA methylase family protein [Burkholderia pseudomallei A79C]KGY00044.1 DNA methylase family protein [Burkholderia pseudomallei A79D]